MNYTCEITEMPAQPVLSIRAHTRVEELPAFLGQAYGMVMQYLAELGEAPAGAPFAAYFNMNMQDLDIEAGFPVQRPLPGRGTVQAGEIPGGSQASVIHTGPYQDCGPAYETLTQFVQLNLREATGVAYEFYLNDPQEITPEQIQMQVVFPLK